MKRLLAYLIVVLGLGLTFNVNAHAFGKGVKVSVDPRSLGTQIDDSVIQKNLATRLAVINKDKKITNGELIAYLKDNVSQEAFTQNRQQDPMLAGDPDKVLLRY
jgi:osmotically-inducible protein OsmY